MNTIGKMLGASIAGAAIAISGCGREKENFPLNSSSLRENVKGLHLFDANKDGKLDLEEAEKYIMVMIDNGNKKISRDELKLIDATISQIKSASPLHHGSGPYMIAYYPPNIEATLASFKALRDGYLVKIQEKEEAPIKERLEKIEKENRDWER